MKNVRVVGYSKNALFKGGIGYLLLESESSSPWKIPLTPFVRGLLK